VPITPRRRFWPVTDHCSGARPRSRFSRSLSFDAAFRSPAAMTLLAKHLRSQVDAPGLHLQDLPDAAPNPFGFALPPPSGFSCRPRRVHGTPPVVRRPHRKPPSVSRLSLPFRIFRSLRIVVLCPVPAGEAYPCRLPDLPSLPAVLSWIFDHGSVLRIRYFLPGSLPGSGNRKPSGALFDCPSIQRMIALPH
jgi:hypothetical protein